jgi:hypothetical protein
MGVNISILDMQTGEGVPEWDDLRYGGDHEVFSVLSSAGYTSSAFGDPLDCMSIERPTDIEHFRGLLHATLNYNSDRWDQMCDLLAADENRGLYFSW